MGAAFMALTLRPALAADSAHTDKVRFDSDTQAEIRRDFTIERHRRHSTTLCAYNALSCSIVMENTDLNARQIHDQPSSLPPMRL